MSINSVNAIRPKSFFRIDYFRQYLKYSHDSTNEKWINVLENACMKDKPLAEVPAETIMEVWDPVSNRLRNLLFY